MDLFRSEEMQLVQLIIPNEAAHSSVALLGDVGLLQFKDLNPDKSPFQRLYASQVKRCDEMARKLRYFSDQIAKAGMRTSRAALDTAVDFDALETKLNELETELLEINSNSDKLKHSQSELIELQLVLDKAGSFFDTAREGARQHQREMRDQPLEDAPGAMELHADPTVGRLGFVTGLILKDKSIAFERVLFRATRGNMFLKQAEVPGKVADPNNGEMVEKNVFVVFFAGERARAKIMKICDAFNANRYPFPEDFSRQRQMVAEVNARLQEFSTTIDASIRHRDSLLGSIAGSVEKWTETVRREKAIYHTLNMFSMDITRKCLLAEGWCPVAARGQIQEALHRAAQTSNASVGTIFQPLVTKDAPPTYFRTNKFTQVFQDIVDAYGVARYREVNPAVFTIVTFPFLFAVMFGDLGHALMMLLFTFWLLYNEKKFSSEPQNEILQMMFNGRYCILLMAIFSLYVGGIYNEFFSMPTTLFGKTTYTCEGLNCEHTGGTYQFGADPIWHGTRTELQFFNSLKMKMSIIMGVAQMSLGIFMSLMNARFFKKPLDLWCEFIPQILFLMSLFGYLSILILVKWVKGADVDLYHVMIYMFLSPGEMEPEFQLFSGQGPFQVFLVLLAFVCVPWMLLPKPLILRHQHNQSKLGLTYGMLEDHSDHGPDRIEAPPEPGAASGHGASDSHGDGHGDGHGGEFVFSDILVHQMIHTIEFVLGAVSNTASYLRLWALSLAHGQLSAVFWERLLLLSISTTSPVAMVIGISAWAAATVGVLMVMESLSAFLHALRLHWVEYMNKFYRGDGYRFIPFSFAKLNVD